MGEGQSSYQLSAFSYQLSAVSKAGMHLIPIIEIEAEASQLKSLCS
jgi:hypothetical protein